MIKVNANCVHNAHIVVRNSDIHNICSVDNMDDQSIVNLLVDNLLN